MAPKDVTLMNELSKLYKETERYDDQIYVHVGHVDANGFNLAGPNR